ncbi:MAG: nucleoside hydrolase [Prevotellaceae bacterium]|nr:nucleoside hydrolase [Prevotellaceae bacterium]MDY3856308.1 nucleoside hydrolase [Bacteroidaceae bacterium]
MYSYHKQLICIFAMLILSVASYASPWTKLRGTAHNHFSKKDIPQIIFDNDMGNDVDDIFALDLLLKYHEAGKIRLIGILTNRDAPSAAAFCDLYDTWCGCPNIPIGIVKNGANPTPEEKSYAYKIWQLKDESGLPLFKTSLGDPTKLPDAVELYRKLLATAPDKGVVIISTGFSTNLARLMETSGDKICALSGMQLIKKKVSWISVMAGDFRRPTYGEYNVINDIPGAKKLFEQTPVPIAFSDFLLGRSIKYPASSIQQDFGWAAHHPLVEAYIRYQKMPYDRPTWDPTAVLYALEPKAGFFELSDRGNVTVTDKGYTHFVPSPTGKCRYLTVTDEQRAKILKFFTDNIPVQHNKKVQ